jgi:hypothetical protein
MFKLISFDNNIKLHNFIPFKLKKNELMLTNRINQPRINLVQCVQNILYLKPNIQKCRPN